MRWYKTIGQEKRLVIMKLCPIYSIGPLLNYWKSRPLFLARRWGQGWKTMKGKRRCEECCAQQLRKHKDTWLQRLQALEQQHCKQRSARCARHVPFEQRQKCEPAYEKPHSLRGGRNGRVDMQVILKTIPLRASFPWTRPSDQRFPPGRRGGWGATPSACAWFGCSATWGPWLGLAQGPKRSETGFQPNWAAAVRSLTGTEKNKNKTTQKVPLILQSLSKAFKEVEISLSISWERLQSC